MIEKRYYLDRKYTVWERQHLVLKKETEEELNEYIKNVDLSSINFYLAKEGQFDEVDVETLYDTMVYLPLVENGYQPTIELLNQKRNIVKDNLNDIEPEEVKMFSINDISKLWNACYDEHFIEQYEDFYKILLKEIIP